MSREILSVNHSFFVREDTMKGPNDLASTHVVRGSAMLLGCYCREAYKTKGKVRSSVSTHKAPLEGGELQRMASDTRVCPGYSSW